MLFLIAVGDLRVGLGRRSVVEITCYSARGPKFSCQYTLGGSELPVNSSFRRFDALFWLLQALISCARA